MSHFDFFKLGFELSPAITTTTTTTAAAAAAAPAITTTTTTPAIIVAATAAAITVCYQDLSILDFILEILSRIVSPAAAASAIVLPLFCHYSC